MTPEQAAAYLQGEVPDIALRRYTAAEIAEFLQRDQLDAEAQEVVRRFGAACEQS